MNEEILKHLLVLLQKELNHMNEVLNMTRDLADALSRNDQTSTRILLRMRGKEIVEIDKIRRKISTVLNSNKAFREKIEALFDGRMTEEKSVMEERVSRTSKSIRETVKKIIETDQHMSVRLAGEESFYVKDGYSK